MTESRRTPGRRTPMPALADSEPPTDRTTDERLAQLEERLREIEGAPGLRERGRGLMSRVVPPEAGVHFRNAGREQLLGVRSIVDFWIRRLDEAEDRAGRRSLERETIEIE